MKRAISDYRMPGPGDELPEDPEGFTGLIIDRVLIGVGNKQARAFCTYDCGDLVDTRVETIEGSVDISGLLSVDALNDIARQIGTKHGV